MPVHRSLEVLLAICIALPLAASSAAADRPPIEREIIPGSELMTPRERERYRQRVRAASTPEEQQAVREDHVKQMRVRARLRGLDLAAPQTKASP